MIPLHGVSKPTYSHWKQIKSGHLGHGGTGTFFNFMAPSGLVKRGERWYHLFGSTQNGYLSNHKVVCRCDFRPHV